MEIFVQMNGNFQLELKKWSTSKDRPFIRNNFRLIRVYHLHFNWLNRKFLSNGKAPRVNKTMQNLRRNGILSLGEVSLSKTLSHAYEILIGKFKPLEIGGKNIRVLIVLVRIVLKYSFHITK